MNGDLVDYESGRRETFEIANGSRTNTTKQMIGDIKRRKANLEWVIAAYRSYRQILVTAEPVRRRRLWADGRSALR